MNKEKHERSLRNDRVGEAYMLMLSVYEECRRQGCDPHETLRRIELAKPWRDGQGWPDEAWRVALHEFTSDHQLPPPHAKK